MTGYGETKTLADSNLENDLDVRDIRLWVLVGKLSTCMNK